LNTVASHRVEIHYCIFGHNSDRCGRNVKQFGIIVTCCVSPFICTNRRSISDGK